MLQVEVLKHERNSHLKYFVLLSFIIFTGFNYCALKRIQMQFIVLQVLIPTALLLANVTPIDNIKIDNQTYFNSCK